MENTSKKTKNGTLTYMILLTTIVGIIGVTGWYVWGIEVGLFEILLCIIAALAAIRFNQ